MDDVVVSAQSTALTPIQRTFRSVAALEITWLLIVLFEAVIFALCNRHPATNSLDIAADAAGSRPSADQLAAMAGTLVQRAQLFGFEFTAVAAAVLMIGLLVEIVTLILKLLPLRNRACQRMIYCVRILVLWIGITGFALSWGAFLTNGSFLDRNSVFFWLQLTHPLRMLFWASPVLICCLPIITLLLAMGGHWMVSRIVSGMGSRASDAWAIGGTFAVGSVALLSVCSTLSTEPKPTSQNPVELLDTAKLSPERIWQTRRYQLGPVAAVLLDATHLGAAAGTMPPASKNIPIVYRPQIAMEDYLKRANLPAVKKWNVVFIEVESMRPDALRALGAVRDIMPVTDSLASESLVFDHAYTQATHSNYAVGCPLASQYPLRSTEQYAYVPNPPYPRVMIYDILKALGYRVGLFSSSNEHWFGMVNFVMTPSVDSYMDAEIWKGPTQVFAADAGFARWTRETNHHGVVDDRFTTQTAIDWIDAKPQQSKPWFVYLNYQASHFPYMVPQDYERKFSPPEANFEMNFGHYPFDKTSIVRGMYDDSLGYVDLQIAKLIDHLKSRGLWDHTLLVLTGDHGQAFYEHGFVTHANMLYNELVRVPLLIHAPRQAARVIVDPVQHVDVPPILLDLMGLPMHPGHQGSDELGANHSPHHAIYITVQTPLAEQYALVLDGYKLIFDKRMTAYAMYDEKIDPQEHHSVIRTELSRARMMIERLDTWRNAQLTYYSNRLYEKECYAPVSPDP